jgi:transcriptional antiterminator NusG
MSKQGNRYDSTRAWYAIHTYSGYEEKVSDSIRQRINAVDMADKIFDVMVPKEKQIQIKNGKRKVVEEKIFQGYVLVEMKLTDETWYIIRNTPGVTGFVGADTTPTPMADSEIRKIKKRMGVEDPKHQINFSEGEVVNITDGPFKGFEGSVSEIDPTKGKLKVMVSMFGRDTPVELDALQVEKV